ncbi:MAG: hypothetical protein WCV99_03045 [Sterolibacterium sp.]|jgi:hypothetical protein
MALTMTRTRTQTTLTKLAQLVAEAHGELVFVERLLTEMPEHREVLVARKALLVGERDALYAALRQFDPEMSPEEIGESDGWRKKLMPRVRKHWVRYYLVRIAVI